MIKIRYYQDIDWKQFQDFTSENWRKDHPILDKGLFEWLFRGYGNSNKKINSIVLLDNQKLIGFRGVIPGVYQVPTTDNKMSLLQGGAYAMWMISREYRGKKLGLCMLKETEKMSNVLITLGSDINTSAPIYQKSMWSGLEFMPRYIISIKQKEYQLIIKKKLSQFHKVECESNILKGVEITMPNSPNINEISKTWKEITFKLGIFSLHRNKEFWQYRYLDHPIFKYHFFGSMKDHGVIVARIENVYTEEGGRNDEVKILRIIEILPNKVSAWEGKADNGFIKLIKGVLNWASKQGCVAADFYCSSIRFESTLYEVGFKKQHNNLGFIQDQFPHNFQPLNYEIDPINIHARIFINEQLYEVDFESTYIVKSDGDIDRPNII